MTNVGKELELILANELFKNIINSEAVQISQLNAVIALLIRFEIPFGLQFSPATREDKANAILTVTLNPTTNIQFTITFDC